MRRLDAELVARGVAQDLVAAREIIAGRAVTVDGAPGLKPGTLVSTGSRLDVARSRRFVSRGGDKLAGALADLELDVSGMRCLDAGAGSGGFTDCLLQAGAEHVTAVDVGYGQFDWTLREDPRVRLLERTNIRTVTAAEGPFDLLVGDLSFVSLKSLATTLAMLAGGRALCLLLVKPQFEVPRERVGAGGIVSDPRDWRASITSAAGILEREGLGTREVVPCRIKGATGNQEFFLLAAPGEPLRAGAVDRALGALL